MLLLERSTNFGSLLIQHQGLVSGSVLSGKTSLPWRHSSAQDLQEPEAAGNGEVTCPLLKILKRDASETIYDSGARKEPRPGAEETTSPTAQEMSKQNFTRAPIIFYSAAKKKKKTALKAAIRWRDRLPPLPTDPPNTSQNIYFEQLPSFVLHVEKFTSWQ